MPQAPTLTTQDEVTVVNFGQSVKSISESVIPVVTDPMLAAGDAEPPLVVLDLQHVEFFSSSFIELMFRLWKRLKSRDGRLAICNLHPYCREVIEITNLDSLWTICSTRDEAVATLKAGT
jgi:anti-anti-sigma factor